MALFFFFYIYYIYVFFFRANALLSPKLFVFKLHYFNTYIILYQKLYPHEQRINIENTIRSWDSSYDIIIHLFTIPTIENGKYIQIIQQESSSSLSSLSS